MPNDHSTKLPKRLQKKTGGCAWCASAKCMTCTEIIRFMYLIAEPAFAF